MTEHRLACIYPMHPETAAATVDDECVCSTCGERAKLQSNPAHPPDSRRFMTPLEVADHLAVSERTVREWLRTGELRSYKIGGVRRIRPEDLDKFLDQRKDVKPR